MNKKLSAGIITILMIVGVVVFAQSNTSANCCPDKPGCICSDEANVQGQKIQIVNQKTNCPDMPSCICD